MMQSYHQTTTWILDNSVQTVMSKTAEMLFVDHLPVLNNNSHGTLCIVQCWIHEMYTTFH